MDEDGLPLVGPGVDYTKVKSNGFFDHKCVNFYVVLFFFNPAFAASI